MTQLTEEDKAAIVRLYSGSDYSGNYYDAALKYTKGTGRQWTALCNFDIDGQSDDIEVYGFSPAEAIGKLFNSMEGKL